jgi:hypothetical protein
VNKHLKTKSASIDQTKVKWQRLLETIQSAACDLDTDSFIHHFWLSRYDYLSAKTLFKNLKRRITKPEAKAFLDALVSDATLYRMIHEVTFGRWSKQDRRIPEALNALQLFRVRQQTPCVLSLLRAFRAKVLKKRHLEDALVAIEKFHFLFTAVTSQRSSGGISEMYASLGRRLFESQDLAAALDVIKELKEKLRDRVPGQEEFRALFPHIVYTDEITKQRALVKYILVGFDKATRTGITTDYDAMTIEHLVPQSYVGTGGFTAGIIGQLGNLILLSPDMNSRLGNKVFKEKKRVLQGAGFPLPPDIASATDWTVQDIQKRTQALADLAFDKVWRI